MNHDIPFSTCYNTDVQSPPPLLTVSLINVVTIPLNTIPRCWKVENTHTHTHTHTGPPPVHILCAWRVKICKASLSSKQKLQGNIGQLSELKCIPGDMSFLLFSWLCSPRLPTVPAGETGISLQFSSNYRSLFWPDSGSSHGNMDTHL